MSDIAYKDNKGENDITYEEIIPDNSYRNTPEGIIFESLIKELKDTLARIDPKAREIFDAIYVKAMSNEFEGLRDVARELGIPWSTFHDKLVIIQEWYKKYF